MGVEVEDEAGEAVVGLFVSEMDEQCEAGNESVCAANAEARRDDEGDSAFGAAIGAVDCFRPLHTCAREKGFPNGGVTFPPVGLGEPDDPFLAGGLANKLALVAGSLCMWVDDPPCVPGTDGQISGAVSTVSSLKEIVE